MSLSKTKKFLLSDATVMIGPMADVFELTPDTHSLGLTKRVMADTEMGFAELTQGLTQTTVFTVNNKVDTRITCEIYEYTARNLAYGAGLDGSAAAYNEFTTVFTLSTQATDASTTLVLATGEGASWLAGDFAVLQQDNGNLVAVVKIASVSTDTLTLAAGYSLPTGVTWAIATTRIFRSRTPLKVGTQDVNPLFGAKLVGKLPHESRPIVMIFPKVRIMKGLSVAFQVDDFSNMPFEIVPYALDPTDTFYADFKGNKTSMVFAV